MPSGEQHKLVQLFPTGTPSRQRLRVCCSSETWGEIAVSKLTYTDYLSCPTKYQATPRGDDCGISFGSFRCGHIPAVTVRCDRTTKTKRQTRYRCLWGTPWGTLFTANAFPLSIVFCIFHGFQWFQPESFKLFQSWPLPKSLVRKRPPHKKILVHAHFWFYNFLPIDIKQSNKKLQNSHLIFLPPQFWDFHAQWTTLFGYIVYITKLLSPRWFST